MLAVDWVDRTRSKLTFLGGGCYSQVYRLSKGKVLKVCRDSDGTRNWLEFCALMQDQGQYREGMPKVDFVVPMGEKGYIAVMDEYAPIGYKAYDSAFKYGDDSVREQYADLCSEFCEYLEMVTGDGYDGCDAWNDIHRCNVMVDSNGDIVITDPSAMDYRRHQAATLEFKLQ